MIREIREITLTIAQDESESNIENFAPFSGGIIYMPAAWDTAELLFLVSNDYNGVYKPLNNAGSLVTIAIDADEREPVPAACFGMTYFKIMSHDGAGVAEAQTAERIVTIIGKS